MTTATDPWDPPVEVARPSVLVSEGALATLPERLIARTIDSVLTYAGIALANLGAGIMVEPNVTPEAEATAGLAIVAGMALLVASTVVQACLVARRGQSLGKMAVGIRIERLDGTLPGFLRGVVERSWAFTMVLTVAGAFGIPIGLLSMFDVLPIFGEQRRCLHDRVAGTRVVKVPRAAQRTPRQG